jgi:glycosyltransferase involved in cell wall biosynthesis
MKKPLISVIMPVYNCEKYLRFSIESILNQSFKNFEFIIINDFSTDSSKRIIEEYKKKDKRIISIKNKRNLGSSISRNIGIKKAMGKYIANMDADDYSLLSRLANQFQILEHSNLFLVASNAIIINDRNEKISIIQNPTKPNEIEGELIKRNCVCHPSVMFRNEGIYYRDKFTYAQDYDLFLRIISNGKKIGNIARPLIMYRYNPNSISLSNRAKQYLFAEKARKFYFEREEKNIDSYAIFQPESILSLNTSNSNSKILIKKNIRASWDLNDNKKLRKFVKKYFTMFGISDNLMYVMYYLLSYLNIEKLKKIKNHILFFYEKHKIRALLNEND